MGTKTKNSYLKEKLFIRIKNLPERDINVLDVFSGEQIIWRWIKNNFNFRINYFPIDIVDYGYFGVIGDNLEYLESLNLDNFDVIDLDSYGIPIEQLEIIFQKKYKGIVFITFIQSIYGNLSKKLLKIIGINEEMYDKCPSIFNKDGFKKLKQYLSIRGVEEVEYIKIKRKVYAKICC